MPSSTPPASGPWTVGSATDCDVVVNQPVVSGQHCRLSLQGSQYVLEDLGSTNGTFVNGYRLDPHSPVYVSIEDKVTLGQSLPLPWPGSQRAQGPPGPFPSGSSSQTLTIGRAPECEIRLDFPMISWQHARISRSGNQ